MASENSPVDELFSPGKLRQFGATRFGSMKAFAEALGMKPPALQGYLNGSRTPGRSVIGKLHKLGFDVGPLLDSPSGESSRDTWEAREERSDPASCYRGSHPPLDIEAAEFVLGRSLEKAAPQFGATPSEVQAWRAGAEPTLEQMVRLTNLVLFIATDGRLNLKVPSGIEEHSTHPVALPAGGATVQSSQAA